MNNPPKKFENPYQGCQKNGTSKKYNADGDINDYNYIWMIRPQVGTMATVMNTLFQRCVLELKRRGIKDITDKNAFEFFVANCVICLPSELNQTNYDDARTNRPSSPTGGIDQTASGESNRRTASSTGELPANASHQQSDLPSGSERKEQTRKRSKGK